MSSTPLPTPGSSPGAVTIPAPVTTPTTENFDTPEYEFSTSAKNSDVLPAWQAGASGKGVKIGIVDSGITASNSDFAGKIDPASRDFGGSGTIDDQYGHGTAIASIAAGARDGSIITGIAYDSTLVVMKVAPAGCSNGCSFDPSAIAQGIRAAAAAGAKVINLSIGGDNPSSTVDDAVRDAARAGAVIVISAGNESASNPSAFATSVESAAPGQVIIVGALGVDTGPVAGVNVDYNQMWAQSNRAGGSADWYIGAPGYAIEVAYQHGYDQVSGTSFAAPAVAGALAVMMQAFPNLTPQQVVQILLTTADDLGVGGVDTAFGHGRLDVGRAFQPIGQTHMAGSEIPVSLKLNGAVPSAAGDALRKGSLNAIVLDAYQRAFTINLARTLKEAARARPLAAAMGSGVQSASLGVGRTDISMTFNPLPTRDRFGLSNSDPHTMSRTGLSNVSVISRLGGGRSAGASFGGGADSLRQVLNDSGPTSFFVNPQILSTPGFWTQSRTSFAARQNFGPAAVTMAYESGQVARSSITDSSATYRLSTIRLDRRQGAVSLIAEVSSLFESGSVLGARLNRAFGSSGSKTFFLDGKLAAHLGAHWQAIGSIRRGWTNFAAGAFTSGAYSLSLEGAGLFHANDTLGFALSQPLRIDSGGFSMLLPGSYDYRTSSASLIRSELSLTPHGREIVGEIAYARPLRRGTVGVNFYSRRDPGHIAGAGPDVGGAVQLRLKF